MEVVLKYDNETKQILNRRYANPCKANKRLPMGSLLFLVTFYEALASTPAGQPVPANPSQKSTTNRFFEKEELTYFHCQAENTMQIWTLRKKECFFIIYIIFI